MEEYQVSLELDRSYQQAF
uniref:Maturase K n=1 Tax=Isotropis cuneifolia TaxID=140926 RepID=Q95CN9_9FABA|nr:maturase K [Isotropis cuneifolia]